MRKQCGRRVAFLIAVLVIGGCGGTSKQASVGTTDSLTERQRDSILAQSSIPGARGVGAAMRVADSTSAGIHRGDSVAP